MKSDWEIVKVDEHRVFIEDLNLGRMSVTNDAENVFAAIQLKYPGRRVIYMDSEGRWDEIQMMKAWMGVTAIFLPYKGV